MSNKRQARRIFSKELKLKVVKDIESGKATIAQVCREFSVSDVSVYNWLNKYSKFHKQGAAIIVELKSEAYRRFRISYETSLLRQELFGLGHSFTAKNVVADEINNYKFKGARERNNQKVYFPGRRKRLFKLSGRD